MTRKNRLRRNLIISFTILLCSGGCGEKTSQQTISDQVVLRDFKIADSNRAWQGLAIDEQYIYVFTDRNEKFALENIISVYTHQGSKVREYRNIYAGGDSQGKFMSFGDGNLIDGNIYVTAYNANSGGRPFESRVLVYSTPEIKLLKTYEIGEGTAESVTKYMNYYWITYNEKMVVKQFDSSFDIVHTYPLSEGIGKYGGYQGAYWENDNFLAQMHGPNKAGLTPSKGLDRYRFDGDEFVFRKTEIPLSYGSGQGVAIYGEYILQNDRPSNSIIVKRSF